MESTAVPPNLFFSKNDPMDPRLGDWILHPKASPSAFHILGYPDDEGIRLNHGRPGAAEGPNSIRNFFYRLTPDPKVSRGFSLVDEGNLSLTGTLAERHARGQTWAQSFASRGARWISLGGGHDYGFCDASAMALTYKEKKPLIVNFDAHLDVRPIDNGLNSGTAFFRLMENHASQCSFIEIGLQAQCNSAAHTEWLLAKGGKIFWRDQIDEAGMVEGLQQLVPLSIHPAFISVDIDAFSSAIAPGCSQSWASGLSWAQFIKAFDFLIESFDVRGLGIYEVSPPLDVDHQTSKLAALIMHRFIFQNLKKEKS